MARLKKDIDWNIVDKEGNVPTWEHVQVAVLMDLRDELKKLNQVFACPNFLEIPDLLRRIRLNTSRIPKGKNQ